MILGFLLIQILLAPLLFFGILFFVERGFQSQFVDQVRNNTYLYAALIKPAVAAGDHANQKEILNDAFLSEDLVLAEFVKPDGTVIRPNSDARTSELAFREDFEYGEHGDQVYFIAAKLFGDDGAPLGTLRLGYAEGATQARIAAAYRYGALLVLGYAVLSIMIAVLFGRRLSRPISQLQKVARSIASGRSMGGLSVNTRILEISRLSNDLERMRQSLLNRQKKIQNREKRISGILDNAGEGIISIDENGVIASFNRAAESIFGFSSAHAMGRNVNFLMAQADQALKTSYRDKFLGNGPSGVVGTGRRVEVQHADGHVFPVHLKVTGIQLDREQIYICIFRDLTEEEKKNRQLLQFGRVVEQSPISIIITDTNGVIEYVNPYFCHVTGYRMEDVYGKSSSILKSGETNEETYRELWETIAQGDIWRGEFQNRKKNGELFWESATICPVLDTDRKITHYIALKEDITEHRQKDLMLSHAMKLEAVGRMTDGIAHDFNNLLTIILGNLQFLKQDASLDHDEAMELASDAMSAAYDGANLVKQLLIFSRRQEHVSKPMELARFMEQAQYLLSRAVPADTNMRLEIAPDVGSVLIDSNRLESAVLNLVINARDAMGDNGELVISVEKRELTRPEEVEGGQIAPGSYVFISVADNGTGMTGEVRQQALEPFFTTKPSATGTGLGLSMVHDLILKSGGGMKIESKLGKGTTVILILPRYQHETKLPSGLPDEFDHLPRGKETVLVVEDQEKVRRFAKRTLRSLGYRVIEAENAAQALDCLEGNDDIDLLFSDIVMPGGMDGRQLAQRASTRYPSLRVLLTTGMELRASEDDRSRPGFPLIDKPYSVETLARAVRDVLGIAQRLN